MQTWTFGPAGIYTATWDGVGRVTITLTTGGNFVAAFAAQSLDAARSSPEYQAILSPAPAGPGSPLTMVATTGINGFALQNATPTILSWTAPNDGNVHRVLVSSVINVGSAATGGLIAANFTDPAGGVHTNQQIYAGGQASGTHLPLNMFFLPIQANSVFTVLQQTALSAGAETLWAEIWAS